MAARSGVLKTAARTLQATLKYAGITAFVILLHGLLVALVDKSVFLATGASLDALGGNQDIAGVLLPLFGANLALELLVGPLFAAMAIYVGRCYTAQREASLYKAVNFALSRYRRLVFPHMAAELSIQLGMIILVPGILFQLQYAFVDSIACFEEEKHPLSRSKRLTRGRRQSIFWLFFPWLIISQGVVFAVLWGVV